jgi:shikimate dehydrogenase
MRVVAGLEILVRQGARSLERWTGQPAPVEAMRAAARQGQAVEKRA